MVRAKRTYNRDERGRFAPSGGTGKIRRGALKATGGSLKARVSAAQSKRRLAAMDPNDRSVKATLSRRAQAAAVTRTAKAATEAGKANRIKLKLKKQPKNIIKKKQTKNVGQAKAARVKLPYRERLIRARQTARRIEAKRAKKTQESKPSYKDFLAKLNASKRRSALLATPLPQDPKAPTKARPRSNRKKTKTDRETADQIQRILDASLDRTRAIGTRTLGILERASAGVAERTRGRLARAEAARDKLEQSNTKNNLQSDRKKHGQVRRLTNQIVELRRLSEQVTSPWEVRNQADMIQAARQQAFYKTKQGRLVKRKEEEAKRAAFEAAVKAWKIRGGYGIR